MQGHLVLDLLIMMQVRLNLEQEPPKPPAYKPPPKPETPEAPAPKAPKTKEEMIECPTRAQQLKDPVGKILEGNKKITGYEMVGKECLPVMEQLINTRSDYSKYTISRYGYNNCIYCCCGNVFCTACKTSC